MRIGWKRSLPLGLLLALGACGGGQNTDDSTAGAFLSGDADRLYDEGMTAFQAGDTVLAEQRFRQSLQANGSYLAAHLSLGQLLLDQQRWAEAAESFRRATELRATGVTGFIGLARAEYGLREYASAVSDAQVAVDLAAQQTSTTNHGLALGVLGDAQLALGDTEGATATLEQALQVDATNLDARLALARLYASSDRMSDALRLLNSAGSYQQTAHSRIELGRLYYELGTFDRAIEVLQAGHAEFPDDDDILYFLAAAHLGAGQRDIAIQECADLLARSPAYLDAYVVRGRAQLRRGDPDSAREDAERVLSQRPDDYGALVLLGDIAAGAGDFQLAEDHLARALSVRPDGRDAIWSMASTLLAASRYADFIALVEPRMERPDTDPGWVEQLATAHTALGNVADALRWRARLAQSRAEDYRLRLEVARDALANPGVLEPALVVELARSGFERSGGGNLEYRLIVIDALTEAGEIDEALQMVESALDAVPNQRDLTERRTRLRRMQ